VWIFCDGSTGGRPGELALACSAAAVAHDEEGQLVDWAWQKLAQVTNNEAEYAGLLLGLTLGRRLRAGEVTVIMDNEVVIGQMQGRFSVHSQALRRWHWQACAAARRLPIVHYCQVPREYNRLADGLAAQAALDWPALRQMLDQERRR
jgi:ribonuclease HI